MKKLCTYLTLFVLSLLCLAQPAAADVTVYFRNTGNWAEPSIHWFRFDGVSDSGSPQAMEKLAGTDNVYFKKLEGATIKDHATDKSQASGIIFTSAPSWSNVTRYDYEAAPTKVKDGYIYDSNGNFELYTPPTAFKQNFTYYVNTTGSFCEDDGYRLAIEENGTIYEATRIEANSYSFEVHSGNLTSVKFWRKNGDQKWNDFEVKAPAGDEDYFQVNSSFNGGEWSKYTTPTYTDYTFYFDRTDSGWDGDEVWIHFWDFGSVKNYTSSPQKMSRIDNGNVYTITITATAKGNILFMKNSDDWNNKVGNIEGDKVQDGYVYSKNDVNGKPYTPPTPVTPFEAGTSEVYISGSFIADNGTSAMAKSGKVYTFRTQISGDVEGVHFSMWYGTEANKSNLAYHIAQNKDNGGGFTLNLDEETAHPVKFGANKENDIYLNNHNFGTITFDAENMKVWFEVDESLIAKFEANTPYYIDLSEVSSWFSSQLYVKYGSNQIYPTLVEGNIYKFTLPTEQTSLTVGYNGNNDYVITPSEGNNCHKVGSGFNAGGSSWYSYNETGDWTAIPSNNTIYIKASFIENWKGFTPMFYDPEKNLVYYDFTIDNGEKAFVMSTSKEGDAENDGIVITHKGSLKTWDIPTKRPADNLPNATRTGHYSGHNFTVTESGRIWFDPVKGQVWLEGESGTAGQAYIAAASYGGINGGVWGDNVHMMTWKEELGVYTAPVRQATKFMVSLNKDAFWSGRYVFNNGTNIAGEVPTGEPQAANIKLYGSASGDGKDFTTPGAGTIYFDPEALKLWYDPKVTEFFEQGKTYYVNVEQYANWNSANLGYKFSENGSLNTGYVEVPNEVFSFTNTEPILKEVILGRKIGSDFFSPMTVQAPTDGSNMIYLKADENGTLVFDRWGTYDAPAHENLYILGEWLGADYQAQQPVRMDYNARTGIYSFYVGQACNLALSLGSTNAEFWGDRALQHICSNQYNVIHMGEPAYNNLKAGNNNGKNTLQLFCPSTVYVRYDVTTDPAKPVMHVWSTPKDGEWPDLYIIGAIIAPKDATQPTAGTNEGTDQWNTIRKLEKDPDQAGLYTYELTKDSGFFNLNDYWSSKNIDGVSINEIGHFNFSFKSTLEDNNTGFWKDPFCPATMGMGFVDRDGTPEPFVYRGSDPNRKDGNWTNTNFVFAEEATVFVDIVRQLVWVELKNEKKPTDVVFHFWDKGGEKYPVASNPNYRWWNDRSNMNCELYIPGTEFKQTVINSGNKHSYVETMTEGAYRYENQDAGMKYKFVLNKIDENFTVAAPEGTTDDFATATLKDNIWVRITMGENGDKVIERPYVYDAIYTQGPENDVTFNHYGEIKNISDPVVTMIPGVNVIHSRVKVPEHPGRYQKDQMIIYPYLNQFYANVRVYQNYLPFYMEGITETDQAPIIGDDGNQVEDRNKNKMFGYPLKEGKEDFFKKFNHAVLEYGTIREIREGSTGVGLIKGLDFANAADDDNLSIKVTYMSEGMIFDRSKVLMLNEYKQNDQLPNLQTSEDNAIDVRFFNGSPEHIGNNGEVSTENHVALDAILDMPFAFRDEMREARAAYIGFKVDFGEGCDANDDVTEGNKYLAENGHPLVWKYWEDGIEEHSVDNWHYEGFYDNHLAVQLHHVVHAKNNEQLKTKKASGTITYHLIVPVATDFSFTTGEAATMSQSRARVAGVNGEEKAPKDVKGDPNDPYVGSVSAGSHYSFPKTFSFDGSQYVPTGVESVGVEDAEAPVEFYNLQGIRINQESLAPGIYIRRQGNKASKVYVR